MIESDTIKLLRECDAGIKMGVESIDEVLPYAASQKLRGLLAKCREEHVKLKAEIEQALARFGDEGKDPNPMAQSMSTVKTNVRLAMNESDKTIADLMTSGCDMGVKSLSRYLNQYQAADEASKDIAKRLIRLEERLAEDMRGFL